MKFLIVGLGNPGPEYFNTRHNVGFRVMDYIAQEKGAEFSVKTLGSVSMIKHKGRQVHLLKPSTFMNLSGKAVRYWMEKLSISQENVLIVLDDVALPFAKQRLRGKGDTGGHNGLKNIDAVLGNNQYARLRIGIGNDYHPGQQVNYVLGTWTGEQEKELENICKYAMETILAFCTIGLSFTMNQYNKK